MAWAPLTVQRMPVCSSRSFTTCRQAPSARAPTVGWSAADWVAGCQVFVVAHVPAVVFIVAGGGRAKGRPYTPSNVLANLYRHLGIDLATTIPDYNQRPMHLLDDREVVRELI